MTDNNNKTPLFLPSDAAGDLRDDWRSHLSDLVGNPLETSPGDVVAFCFSLTSGRVVFGVPLQELADSYLVALPALLYSDGESIRGRALARQPIIRLFKSNITFLVRAPEEQGYFYYKYLESKTAMEPLFFTPDRVESIRRRVSGPPSISALAAAQQAEGADEEDQGEGYDPAEAWRHMPYNKNTKH